MLADALVVASRCGFNGHPAGVLGRLGTIEISEGPFNVRIFLFDGFESIFDARETKSFVGLGGTVDVLFLAVTLYLLTAISNFG